MGMFKWLSGLFREEDEIEAPANVIREPISSLRIVRVKPAESYDENLVNPATGYPMLQGGAAGFDVMGNPFGTDLSDYDAIDESLNACDLFHHDPFDRFD